VRVDVEPGGRLPAQGWPSSSNVGRMSAGEGNAPAGFPLMQKSTLITFHAHAPPPMPAHRLPTSTFQGQSRGFAATAGVAPPWRPPTLWKCVFRRKRAEQEERTCR
jgi:hypothetical protein